MLSFNVTVLGMRGAGKTVYVAGLHRELSIPRPELGIVARTDFELAKRLNGLYEILVDPDRDFPASTPPGSVIDWRFTCVVNTPGGAYEPLEISYWDYAGEQLNRLTETRTAGVDFATRMEQTDVFLVLIDGYKVLQLMRGDPSGVRYLHNELSPILGLLSYDPKPVQFVLTKGDLLDGRFEFAAVRERLLEHQDLADFLAARRRLGRTAGTIRLIPVSVTGGFAELDEEGRVVKVPGAPVSPVNVEIPFCAIFPDLVAQARREMEEAAEDLDGLDLPADPRAERARQRGVLLGEIAQQADEYRDSLSTTLSAALGKRWQNLDPVAVKKATDSFLTWASAYLRRQRDMLERQSELPPAPVGAASDDQALRYAADSLAARLAAFERSHPGSVLVETDPP